MATSKHQNNNLKEQTQRELLIVVCAKTEHRCVEDGNKQALKIWAGRKSNGI
jgi:hypothetical protein